MTKKQATELFINGKNISIVELREVKAGKFDAKPDEKKEESHFQKYTVLRNSDKAEVTHYAPKGAKAAQEPLKFTKNQFAVVIGDFERTKYGVRCQRADLIELLTD